MSVPAREFDRLEDGLPVTEYTLQAGGALTVRVLDLGGIVTAIEAPDRDGAVADVVLGLRSAADYRGSTAFFGALIGRYANRIANGRFTLDGQTYELPRNDGEHTLHGGPDGFDKQLWQASPAPTGDALRLERTSAAGEEGFPGRLDVAVTYTVTPDAELRIVYEATAAAPTVLNLTNHTYFNLRGEGSGEVLATLLQLGASRYTPVSGAIPTGEIADVAGTPLDFREPRPLGARIREGHPQIAAGRGYDHNFVIDRPAGDQSLAFAARAVCPASGRVLEVHTTQPGVQLYTGNFLDGSLVGKGGGTYRQSDGFCLETQHFPDSPNQPSFPSTVLRPGERFESETVYRFTVDR